MQYLKSFLLAVLVLVINIVPLSAQQKDPTLKTERQDNVSKTFPCPPVCPPVVYTVLLSGGNIPGPFLPPYDHSAGVLTLDASGRCKALLNGSSMRRDGEKLLITCSVTGEDIIDLIKKADAQSPTRRRWPRPIVKAALIVTMEIKIGTESQTHEISFEARETIDPRKTYTAKTITRAVKPNGSAPVPFELHQTVSSMNVYGVNDDGIK